MNSKQIGEYGAGLMMVILCGSGMVSQLCCSGSESSKRTASLNGSRQESSNRRASAERPHPWDEEQGPFQHDRLELEPYIAQQRAQHQEEHSQRVEVLRSFDHPTCAGLSPAQRKGCPLLEVNWVASKEVPGGVLLTGSWQGETALLRQKLHCHMAFGKVYAEDSGCPLHGRRIRASLQREEQYLYLRLISEEAAAVSELRQRVKQLVP